MSDEEKKDDDKIEGFNEENNLSNEENLESENKLESDNDISSQNNFAFDEKKQVIRTKAEEEKFFIDSENSKVIDDVDRINSEIEDVDLKVGQDVFAGLKIDNGTKFDKFKPKKMTKSEKTNTEKEESAEIVEESENLEVGEVQEKEVKDTEDKIVSADSGNDVVDGVLYKNLDTVLHESMIPYSEHVILDRAIPRVEDGLKPVQRRILYSMMELGVTPDKPFRKSARIVGDCLGKYHPHGDSSVYDAMVRLAQPFNTNMILVEGHGNFGSVDGDGAAAMRYTEARLAPIALELLRDLDKNTVRWGLNFDDTLKEPEILPGRFPNLLVNGSTGIAVGLATNIPPHNLAETIDAVVAYIDNPKISLKEMMKIIKGPDFPTGGYILNTSEIYQAYSTGKGKIYIRAKMHIEEGGADKKYIVITEMPYQVNKSQLLQKINSLREEDKYGLGVISEVRDESDRDGMRAVIRLKKDADVKAVYESLIKNTELQTTFGVNMVAIAGGKPKLMGLLDVVSYYVEYQREIILRRSKYDCEQAKEREHILSGLIIAIKNIDAVVKIIKTSKNTIEAKKRLREKFILSEKQAQAILDMRLARLTSLEVFKLEEEIKSLRALIKKLTAIIESNKLQLQVVKEEILQIKKEHKKERKTKFLKSGDSLKFTPSNIEVNPANGKSFNINNSKNSAVCKMVILKTADNNFKSLAFKNFNLSRKEIDENTSKSEIYTMKLEIDSNKTILAFSNLGNCFKANVKEFGECRLKDKGINEKLIFTTLKSNEKIVFMMDFDETNNKDNLLFLTKFGMIKKTALSEYSLLKKDFQAIKLKENDEVTFITKEPNGDYNFIFVTSQGMILRAENKDVPLQGRVSGGVKGIALSQNDYCVCTNISQDGGEIFAITDNGTTKRVIIETIDKMVRYRKGLKFINLGGNVGSKIVSSGVVLEPFIVIVFDVDNNMYYKSTDLMAIESRVGKGKPFEKSKKKINVKEIFFNID